MQLVFKLDLGAPLERTIAAGKYKAYWEENQAVILDSMYRHTGLRFKQRKITVHVVGGETSRAGNSHRPMQLAAIQSAPDTIGAALLHELSHRLIVGNGIEPSDKSKFARSRANYHMHRQIDLFLYDVMRDILGEAAARTTVAEESTYYGSGTMYSTAWKWALGKSYDERQRAFARLKKQYKAS